MKKILTCLFVLSSLFCCTRPSLAAEPAVYEFESYEQTSNKIKDSESASGGKYVQVSERSKNTEHTITVPVAVEEGDYILEFAASEETKNAANSAGPMYFQIDDQEEIKVSSTSCTFSDITPVYPSEVFKISKIRYKTSLSLSEGAHEIKVTLRPNSDTEKTKGALDYLSLTKEGEDYPAMTDGAILLEAESVCNSGLVADETAASGGKVCKIMYVDAQALEFKFTCAEEMQANLEIAAAEAAFVGTHLSPVFFTLNDQPEVRIGNGNTKNLGGLFTHEFQVNQLRYQEVLTLKKGVNTLTVRVPRRETFNQDAAFCVLDYVSLRKIKEVTSLTSEIPGIIKRGEKIPLQFKNQDNESISAENLDSIEIVFEDSYLGEFSDGAAYARNYGKTNLQITAKKGSSLFTLTAPIEIISETGLSLVDAKREGKEVVLTFLANGDYAGKDKVLVAAYRQGDGMLTSVTELLSEELSAASDGETIKIKKTVTDADAKISVFIVSGADSESAVYQKITL